MAIVFKATDLRYHRTVAIKVLRPRVAASMGQERFLKEITLASRLQHPGIIPLYESGMAGNLPYFVMPFITGQRLRDRLARDPQLPLEEVVRYTRDIASALDYAHAEGVVHRDIKPENILLLGDRVVVADFGLARAMTVAEGDHLTGEGLAVGTPEYMSPEQIDAGKTVDGRTDVYSLGCVVFEMLAGEPPFTGRSVQNVLARHLAEPPPAVDILRPALPPGVAQVVTRALAKVPADRFSTAGALADGLAAATAAKARNPTAIRWTSLIAAGLAVLALAAVPVSRAVRTALARPDPNRVLVFPLLDRETPPHALTGEDVAAYIGYALEGTAPLRWEEGGAWLAAEERTDPGRAGRLRQREVSLGRRARYFIDGTILRGTDSLRVVLTLYDAAGDTIVRSSGRAGAPGASEARLGVLAVADLIPVLVDPGRRIDVTPLADRRASAIALFLLGERAYRRTRFAAALPLYEAAIAADSAFAMAALKGAQAASWTEQYERADTLARIAVSYGALLPLRYRHLIQGLASYLAGDPESALTQLGKALAIESSWSEAWTAVGETYFHLLPRRGLGDSMAAQAFRRAWEADTGFTPPLFHLTQLAVRRGALGEAERFRALFATRALDPSLTLQLNLMVGCLKGAPRGGEWPTMDSAIVEDVLDVARLLAPVPGSNRCAESGYRQILGSRLGSRYRFAALYGLQSLLVVEGRYDDTRRLLESPVSDSLGGRWFYLMDFAAGAPFQSEADSFARASGSDYRTQSTTRLWALGLYETRHGTAEPIGAISRALKAKADSSGTPVDALFAAIMAAHATLAAGDSGSAERQFATLRPRARRNELAWSLWAPLGLERLRWAELLLARHQPEAAIAVAELLEAPQPGGYLLYLPGSLKVRARAWAAAGRSEQARVFTRRLAALQGSAAGS
jgi:serine/threonine-protein kinase